MFDWPINVSTLPAVFVKSVDAPCGRAAPDEAATFSVAVADRFAGLSSCWGVGCRQHTLSANARRGDTNRIAKTNTHRCEMRGRRKFLSLSEFGVPAKAHVPLDVPARVAACGGGGVVYNLADAHPTPPPRLSAPAFLRRHSPNPLGACQNPVLVKRRGPGQDFPERRHATIPDDGPTSLWQRSAVAQVPAPQRPDIIRKFPYVEYGPPDRQRARPARDGNAPR